LVALPELHGGRSEIVAGIARLAATPAAAAAKRLLALFDAATAMGLGPHLTADLGEVRGFAYYTGAVFHAYAPGTGDAVGSGGRYDELLGRFGWNLPAAGFALDLDRLGEALQAAGVAGRVPVRVVVVGPAQSARLAELRGQGIAAVAAESREAAVAWARAWGFTHVLDPSLEGESGAKGLWIDAATGAFVASPVWDSAQTTGRPEHAPSRERNLR
jgi:ATP phosphoribosyltransferase regulatory subunit